MMMRAYRDYELTGDDLFGIKAARRYEQRMFAAGLTTPILRRAKELREGWASFGLYHTENATSIVMAAAELGQGLMIEGA